MRLYWQNLIDQAGTVLTAASEAAELPASNVAHPFLGRIYRSAKADGAQSLTVELPEAAEAQAFIVAAHTIPEAAAPTLLATLDDTDFAPENLLVNEEVEHSAGTLGLELAAPVTAKYWRLIWNQAASVDIGRLFLGPFTVLDDEPDQSGYDRRVKDLSRTQRAQSGQDFSEIRPRVVSHSFRYSFVNQTFIDKLDEVAAAVGTHTPLFFWLPDLSSAPIYARLTEQPRTRASGADDGILYDTEIELEEQIAAYAL